MNNVEFNRHIENALVAIHSDFKFSNYSKQLLAKKLKAEFNSTYNLDYLWNRIIAIISGSCFLLENDKTNKTALINLYNAAQILENISEIPECSEKFDLEYFKILSALCYDISGYQANAYCLASRLLNEFYELESIEFDVSEDNFIINQIVLILRKEIYYARDLARKNNPKEKYSLIRTIIEALIAWYNNILDLARTDYLSLFRKAYLQCIESGNVYLSQLILLLITKIQVFSERSICLKLSPQVNGNFIWRKFVKLLANDNYDNQNNKIKEPEKRKSIYEFWVSQIRALDDDLLSKDENFVVQMPTSAGKTFIAELYLLDYLVKYPEKKTIYISPFRALSSEKVRDIGQYFSKLGYSVSSLSGSYETDVFDDFIFKETDVLILTPEKADLLFRQNPEYYENVSAVIFDEGHIVGEISSRSAIEEFLIIRLKIKHPEIRMLFISAVMPKINAEEYAEWLSKNKENVLRSKLFQDSSETEIWEPTRKNIGCFLCNKQFGRINFSNIYVGDERARIPAFVSSFISKNEFGENFKLENDKPNSVAALGYKLSEDGNVLIFCGQVRRIETLVKRFLDLFNHKNISLPKRFSENSNTSSFYYAKLWYGEDHYITKALGHGIGIHFGDMVEQVRNAVEQDFKNKNLAILLCTNTVGQGINFPIKHLIIYEPSVGYTTQQELIKNRDFWNLVGRVGRAEKETEGNIFYVVNTGNDLSSYNKYINKDNIENSESLLFRFLTVFLEGRISEENFEEIIQLLSETYLLDLIQEEAIDESIDKIISNSLFALMATKQKLDVEPIKKCFHEIYDKIKEENPKEEIFVFSRTGLSIESNKSLLNYIQSHKDEISKSIELENNYEMLNYFLIAITENTLKEIAGDYRLNKLENRKWIDYFPIVESWMKISDIKELRELWIANNLDDWNLFYQFLASGLYYLFPWVYSAFVQLCAFVLEKEFSDIPKKIRLNASFMKYGLNTEISCLARILGIKTRETALFLENKSLCSEEINFISWLSNLQESEINSFKLDNIEKENVIDVVLKFNLKSYRDQPTSFEFEIKGTEFNPLYKENSKLISVGMHLNLERDYANEFDPFAIFIKLQDNIIGYLPREYTKYIATEIDLNETKYDIIVTQATFDSDNSYKKIKVTLNQIYDIDENSTKGES